MSSQSRAHAAITHRRRRRRWPTTLSIFLGVCACGLALSAGAQQPGVHYQWTESTPPGAIGAWQHLRGAPLACHFQPVKILAPEGVRIAWSVDGKFVEPREAPVELGLLIAPVYRLRVTHLPLHDEAEVYPTIEVVDRLYPPTGQARRFPIPIELTQEDLELAADGKFVTRVIYLEDPDTALPFPQQGEKQNWFDAGVGANPVQVADTLGRPVAILRMGGRLPAPDERSREFFGGFPPLKLYTAVGVAAEPEETIDAPAASPLPQHSRRAPLGLRSR